MNPILIIVCIIFALFLLKGYMQGFFKMIFVTVAFAACIFLSGLLVNPVSVFLRDNTGICDAIEKPVANQVSNNKTVKQVEELFGTMGLDANSEISGIPLELAKNSSFLIATAINAGIDSYTMPQKVKDQVYVTSDEVKTELSADKVSINSFVTDLVSSKIAFIILKIIVYAILMVLIYILCRVIFHFLNIFARLPVISGVNRILGLIVGVAEAYLLVCIIFTVFTFISSTPFGTTVMGYINSSAFLTAIYNCNIVLALF